MSPKKTKKAVETQNKNGKCEEIEEQLRYLYNEVREKTTELMNLQKQSGLKVAGEEIPSVSKFIQLDTAEIREL